MQAPQEFDLSKLSPRERECWELKSSGLSKLQVAQVMGISRNSVGTYLDYARQKLGLRGTGLYALTAAELRCIKLMALGWTNRQIAKYKKISRKTVNHHLTAAYRKLGLDNRFRAIIWTHSNLPETVDELREMVKDRIALIRSLTERERQYLAWTAKGLSDQQIAVQMRISFGTARHYGEIVRGKLEVGNNLEAGVLWILKQDPPPTTTLP